MIIDVGATCATAGGPELCLICRGGNQLGLVDAGVGGREDLNGGGGG